jgi:predicted unusual protein kinase regulating ubiquinone biosynthesis (AarF/ABC1/UbiB family)
LAVAKRFRSKRTGARLTRAAHQRNARRIEAGILRLRGLFIKVGQLISIMANVLPDEFREPLERLQDQVPPRAYGDIEARIREEFGGKAPTELFASFAPEPIASASIGQVHVAHLPTGEKVAVKVQYPDIEAIVRTDLVALRRIFGVLKLLMAEYGFDTIYQDIQEMVLAELDYRKEAAAIRRIAGHFAARGDRLPVRIPRVIEGYATERVLTLEWMEGTKIADLEGLAALGLDRRRAARLCVEAYCQQIFLDGEYHADPHPGNLLLQRRDDGEPLLVFLDFGATASISENMRRGMMSFLQGAMTRDTSKLVSSMKEMGFISRRADPEVFDRVVEYFHDRLRAQVKVEGWTLKDLRFDAKSGLDSLIDLRSLNVSLADIRDAFHIPKEWILLERALLLLLGVCTTLDPDLNPTEIIQPYLERFLLGERKEWSEIALESTREMALSALALPTELQRLSSRLLRGEVEVKLRGFDDSARLLYAASEQLLAGLLGATATVLAVVFDGRGQTHARLVALAAAVLFGVGLAWSRLKARRHLSRRR